MACDIKPELLQDMPEHDSVGTNGSSNTHTTIDSITGPAAEQSDESNLDPTLAPTEQTKGEEKAVVGEEVKPQKPANG